MHVLDFKMSTSWIRQIDQQACELASRTAFRES